MGDLTLNTVVALIVWATIAIALYRGMRRFPQYRYEDLKRASDSSPYSEYRWYYSIPPLSVWVAVGFAGFVIVSLKRFKSHPETFAAWLQANSEISLWLNDVSGDSLAVFPLSLLLFGGCGLLILATARRLLPLLSVELTSSLFPAYQRYHVGLPGRFAKLFQEEIKSKIDRQENPSQRYWRILPLAVVVVYLIQLKDNGVKNVLPLAGVLVASVLYSLYRERGQRRFRKDEFRKRFDSAKLVTMERGLCWKRALRAWIILPPLIVVLAHIVPFYVFDEDGVHEHRYRKQAFTPWHQVSSLRLGFRYLDPSKDSGHKRRQGPRPRLDIVIITPGGPVDLDELSALTHNAPLAERLIELVRKKGVAFQCDSEPKGEEELQAYLSDPKRDAGPEATFKLVQGVCNSKEL